jgi:lipopolysaccharide transport system permease protein
MAVTAERPRSEHTTVIEAEHGFTAPNLRELWEFRDLVRLLVRRDVAIRYRQSAVGAAWAVIHPVALAGVFSLFLGRLAKVPSVGDIPYPLFALAGMVMWIYIQQAFSRTAESTVASGALISKVYFPRLAIPLVAVAAPAVDFCVAFVVLVGAMLLYGEIPGPQIVLAPFVLLLGAATALGLGLWMSAVAVRFRDIAHLVPFMTQVTLFITPIVYAFDLVPAALRPIYALNPLVGIMEAWRWTLFGEMSASPLLVLIPVVVSCVLIVTGAVFFHRAERSFADHL